MSDRAQMEGGTSGTHATRPDSQPDPRQRFSDRVEQYVKHRPSYPPAVLDFLKRQGALGEHSAVADIGSGTGISAQLFLSAGHVVYGVEPNVEMRSAAERLLCPRFRSFHSVDGSAEATTLPDRCVDLVVAAQAFHWFDRDKARNEFRHILRPGGHVVLLWNTRKTGGSPFLKAYERLLNEYGTDYRRVRHDNASRDKVAAFFAPAGFREARFPNEQAFDYAGLKGRLLSSSYAPAPGHPRHEPMLRALRQAFDQYAEAGRVRFLYDTEVFVGGLEQLPPPPSTLGRGH